MKPEAISAIYERNLASPESTAPLFPTGIPAGAMALGSPANFVDALVTRAAENDIRARHPFLRQVASGQYSRVQLREWVRQSYQSVLAEIRRHALMAAAARDCDLLRALLAYVGVEADADPVGGAFFSLPQLWVKFGISLGLSRDEIVHATPATELVAWEERTTTGVSRDAVPVSLFVNAVLAPALAGLLGRRLQSQLGLPRDACDYFWAVAGNRWGEDVGYPILLSYCATPEERQEIWRRYALECQAADIGARLSILQDAVESVSRA